MKSVVICTPCRILCSGKIEKNEMGGACGAYGAGERGAQGSGGENLKEKVQWGDPDADGRIILKWFFRKWEGVVRTGWSWPRIGTGAGTCEYGDEPSGSKNAGNFLTSCRTS